MSEYRNLLYGTAVFATLWVFGAAIVNIFYRPVLWPMIVGIVLALGWYILNSKIGLQKRVMVTCPECGNATNLNQDWTCGYCDEEKSPFIMQTFVRYSLPLEECNRCQNVATAIECPHCYKVMIFDPEGYEQSIKRGQKKEIESTVARFE